MSPTLAFHLQFSFDRSLGRFQDSSHQDLLSSLRAKSHTPIDGLASGAVIFKRPFSSGLPRILLIQRAPTDSMPLLWEVPGGAVDEGETALDGASREVAEETGLITSRIDALLEHRGSEDALEGGYIFSTRRGKKIVKFTFVVQVEQTDSVKLDPEEHVNYAWATEEECRAKRVVKKGGDGGEEVVELNYTTAAQEAAVLSAFDWRKGVEYS